jgi:hypothetical protein
VIQGRKVRLGPQVKPARLGRSVRPARKVPKVRKVQLARRVQSAGWERPVHFVLPELWDRKDHKVRPAPKVRLDPPVSGARRDRKDQPAQPVRPARPAPRGIQDRQPQFASSLERIA